MHVQEITSLSVPEKYVSWVILIKEIIGEGIFKIDSKYYIELIWPQSDDVDNKSISEVLNGLDGQVNTSF
jgi:hypothetical protein